jgi:hypothetical protein
LFLRLTTKELNSIAQKAFVKLKGFFKDFIDLFLSWNLQKNTFSKFQFAKERHANSSYLNKLYLFTPHQNLR